MIIWSTQKIWLVGRFFRFLTNNSKIYLFANFFHWKWEFLELLIIATVNLLLICYWITKLPNSLKFYIHFPIKKFGLLIQFCFADRIFKSLANCKIYSSKNLDHWQNILLLVEFLNLSNFLFIVKLLKNWSLVIEIFTIQA